MAGGLNTWKMSHKSCQGLSYNHFAGTRVLTDQSLERQKGSIPGANLLGAPCDCRSQSNATGICGENRYHPQAKYKWKCHWNCGKNNALCYGELAAMDPVGWLRAGDKKGDAHGMQSGRKLVSGTNATAPMSEHLVAADAAIVDSYQEKNPVSKSCSCQKSVHKV